MLIGYARTSTVEQEAGFEAQLRDLGKAGCEKVFKEQVSSVAKRMELETALDFIRENDTLVVTKLDRLARSTAHLLDITKTLEDKRAFLEILDQKLDTSTPNGRMLLTMLGAIAQFEREIMLERQREGIAKAKNEGKYKGRKATALEKTPEVIKLHEAGKAPVEIVKEIGISRASVFRILKTYKEATA